jgi:hypothetical protein
VPPQDRRGLANKERRVAGAADCIRRTTDKARRNVGLSINMHTNGGGSAARRNRGLRVGVTAAVTSI